MHPQRHPGRMGGVPQPKTPQECFTVTRPEEPLARRGWEWGVSGSAVASPSEVACPRCVGCLQLMCGALYEQLGCETGLLIVCWEG